VSRLRDWIRMRFRSPEPVEERRRTHEELERTRQRAHEISCRADQVIKKYGELGESSHR